MQLPGPSHKCPTCRQSLPAGISDPVACSLNYALEDVLRENLQVAVTLLAVQLLLLQLCQQRTPAVQVSKDQVPQQSDTTGQAGVASQASHRSPTHGRCLPAESSGPLSFDYAPEELFFEDLQVAVMLLASLLLLVAVCQQGPLLCRCLKSKCWSKMTQLVKHRRHHKVRNGKAFTQTYD